MSATIEPVTVGGWYERGDGSVGEYRWLEGQLQLVRTVAGWASVPSREEENAEAWRASQAEFRRRHEAGPSDGY